MTTIYALKHPDTGVVRYFGKTTEILNNRLKRHLSMVRRGGKYHLCNWIRSLPSPPVIVPVLVTEDRYASAAERFAIALGRAAGDDLVNGTDGGEGTPGLIRTPEHCAAISKSHLGKKLSAEHRAALAASHLGKKRGPHSPEHRAAISRALTGKTLGVPWSDERRAAQRKR